jgi:hypothetical protein
LRSSQRDAVRALDPRGRLESEVVKARQAPRWFVDLGVALTGLTPRPVTQGSRAARH